MPTTPIYGLTTPVLADENNVPADLASLATQAENALATAVKVEVLGATLTSSSWDRVAGYGIQLTRDGRTYTLTFGIRQIASSPTIDIVSIPASAAPVVNAPAVCACSNASTGMVYVSTAGVLTMAVGYGPAKPAGTLWMGSVSWTK